MLPKDDPKPSESFDFLGMMLLSPGLALFLFGVSSTPQTGTIASARVLVPAIIGGLLVITFIWHALQATHPLIDLRLFRHRQLTVSVITMSLFSIAFFGAMLLFPTYFIKVRLESTLSAGILLAPQGIGAMFTMPLAGKLTDRRGPGWIVLSGIALIITGMAVFTQVSDTSNYVLLLGALFVMGMGMGATMMPIMSAALGTLTHQEVARGSTLMNIVQQVAGSIGTAVMSVILTNQFLSKPAVQLANEAARDPSKQDQLTPDVLAQVPGQMAEGFAVTFTVALVLVVACLVPTLLLPRKGHDHTEDSEGAPQLVAMH
jgi:EmrB/QacA subfamily drug resistance transporter